MKRKLHHILEKTIIEGDFCWFVLHIQHKVVHISLSVNKIDIAFEVNETLSFRYLLNPYIKVIQSVLKDVLSTGVVYLFACMFVFFIIFLESHLQIFV